MVSLCFCFPPSAKIRTTRGEILISDLEQTDKLLTSIKDPSGKIKTKTSPFMSYLHIDPDLQATFLTLKYEGDSELVISEDHLIFKLFPESKWGAVRAKSIQLGDQLIHFDKNTETISYPRVVGIDKRVIKGVYAPLSVRGTVIVDSILTSCYGDIDSHDIAHVSFALLRLWFRSSSFFMRGKDKSNGAGYGGKSQLGIHKYAKALSTLRRTLPKKITPN